MGAGQSNEARTVSMDNPSAGVIDVTDEVVQRLKKGLREQEAQILSEEKPDLMSLLESAENSIGYATRSR